MFEHFVPSVWPFPENITVAYILETETDYNMVKVSWKPRAVERTLQFYVICKQFSKGGAQYWAHLSASRYRKGKCEKLADIGSHYHAVQNF